VDKVRLTVEGMSCEHCVRSVDSALRGVNGVQELDVRMGEVDVSYDPDSTDVTALLEAVEDEGYVAYRAEGT
jgi:copper chaperone